MANSTIASLMVELGLDSSHMEQGLKGATDKLGGFKKAMSTGVGGAATKVFGGTALAGMTAFAAAGGTAALAIGGATVALGKMAIEAAPLEGIRNSFDGISKSAGSTGDAMLSAMQKGSSGMVTSKDLMMSFNTASQLVGVDFAQKLPDAMGYLGKVSAATGQDMGFMLDSLVKGIGRVSPMILDNLGIQIALSEGTERAAKMFGKETEALSKSEIQAGMMEVTMEKLAENTAAMPDVVGTAAQKFAMLQATFTNVKDSLGMAFLPVMTQLADVIQGLIDDGTMDTLIGLVSKFAGILGPVISSLSPLVELLSDLGGVITDALGSLLEGDFEGASKTFSAGIGGFAKGISKILPSIIRGGGTIILGLVQGLVSSMPALATSAMTILPVLITEILAMLPEMLSLGLEIIVNLVNGIAIALPTLIPAMYETVFTMVQTILENAPMLIEAAISIILALVEGLIASLPIIIEQAPLIVSALVTAIITSLPLLFNAAAELILALAEGIIDNLPALLLAAATIIMELVGGIMMVLPQLYVLGIELITKLKEGIISLIDDFKASGGDIIEGLKQGITEKFEEVKTEVAEFGQGLLEKIRAIFDISSPSGVMEKIGEFLVSGLSKGLEALTGIGEMIVGAFTTAKELLMPIITGIATFLQTTFTAALTGISNFLSVTLPLAITTLAGLFMNTFIPVLSMVGTFLQTYMTSIILEFSELMKTSLLDTTMLLAVQWREYLYTAIFDTYNLIKKLMVTIKVFISLIIGEFSPAIMVAREQIGHMTNGLSAIRSEVTKLIKDIKELIIEFGNLSNAIPEQFLFNSPPPFAQGLGIITSNMKSLRAETKLFSKDIAGVNAEITGTQVQQKYPTADEIGKAVVYALQQMGAV